MPLPGATESRAARARRVRRDGVKLEERLS